jgi:hypothetical protein
MSAMDFYICAYVALLAAQIVGPVLIIYLNRNDWL